MTERELFIEALSKDAGGRAVFLDEIASRNPLMRDRLEILLKACEQAGSFMQQPDITGEFTSRPADQKTEATATAILGSMIAGKYKLLELIGEGGMGAVYMAQQTEPVKRLVAIKVIKTGMDSKQVLARFESERQALAVMDHPNIAKILDGGSHEGSPYFVMELVKGVPITKFCDERKMSPRERLELFVPVCQAIQHAHQKGIIHRDIKPSNVMVALYDDQPVPKVIDFGVAKATTAELTEATLHTGYGAVIGTPEYMSPEQANFNQLDIDTRSDVYSLGILLYELLTGRTPLDRKSLGKAALLEVLRIVREVEPSKPSTKLSTDDALPSIAAQRHTEPAKLTRLMKGELDWIVMKALEKDRTRRYETANGFARDIQRYLADESVEACPPSARYRLGKFARKNRAALATAASISLLLIGGVAMSLWLASRARDAERVALKDRDDKAIALQAAETAGEAERKANEKSQKRLSQLQKTNGILTSIFNDLNPLSAEKEGKPLQALLGERLDDAARQLVGDEAGNPLAVANLQMSLGNSLRGLGFPLKALALYQRASETYIGLFDEKHPSNLAAIHNIASAYCDNRQYDLALPLLEKNLPLRKAQSGERDNTTLMSMDVLAGTYLQLGRLESALPLLAETLKLRRETLGNEHRSTLYSMNNLALAHTTAGDNEKARALYEEAAGSSRATLGSNHPSTLLVMNNLAKAYETLGHMDRAMPIFLETLELRTARLGANHPETMVSLANLACAYRDTGRHDLALPLLTKAFEMRKARLGPNYHETYVSMKDLAIGYEVAGQSERAFDTFRALLALQKAHLGEADAKTLDTMDELGLLYHRANRLDLCIPLYEETVRLKKAQYGPDHTTTIYTYVNLGAMYRDADRTKEALTVFEDALTRVRKRPEQFKVTAKWLPEQMPQLYDLIREYTKAEPFHREALAEAIREHGRQTLKIAPFLDRLGESLVNQKKWAEAEPLLLESLKLWEDARPEVWRVYFDRALIGACLLGQGRFGEAEPMLLAAYGGMQLREGNAKTGPSRRREIGEYIVQLYEATNQPDKAAEWRQKLPPELLPMPRVK